MNYKIISVSIVLLFVYYFIPNILYSHNNFDTLEHFNVPESSDEPFAAINITTDSENESIISVKSDPLFMNNDNQSLSRIRDEHYLKDQRQFYLYQMTFIQ
jgi:hypothetical protein